MGYCITTTYYVSIFPLQEYSGTNNILTYLRLMNSVCIYHIETLPICLLGLSRAQNSNIVLKFNLN